MGDCGWFPVVADGFRWFRMVSDGFGWFAVLVATVGGNRNFTGGIFLSSGGKLWRSDFDHSYLFQS